MRAHGERIAVQAFDVCLYRLGEGLVLGRVGLAILIPVEEREVHDPQEVMPLTRDTEGVGHVGAHATEDLISHAT